MNKSLFLSILQIIHILPIFTLCSCDDSYSTHMSNPISSSSPSSVSEISHSYDEVSYRKIYWSNIFTRPEDNYYVYLYSLTCSHCASIKNQMIEYTLSNVSTIYFIESSPEINIDSKIDCVNVESLNDLTIKGFPTLLVLDNHVVTKNLAGTKLILDELGVS